ncbi:hypothetical protein [Altericroceibacterium xinjiangense]|uniref:hypothetical protein n=1 Tax=Altericroceibacterium xinjiangense TaxID=762261 RepID=UPI000F7FAA53|nr:hypothetical protein [Altericroceibacterium xinjiangense]
MAQQAGNAPAATQQPQRPDRIAGRPNINGIWQVMNTANYDLEPHSAQTAPSPGAEREMGAIAAIPAGRGVVEGGLIPYLPEARERREENRTRAPQYDPEAACYLPGIPRATYMDYPFQIIQGGNDDILMAYEYHGANRAIQMGDIGIPAIDTWMGTSYGTWEGDTLVVTTLSQSPGDMIAPGGGTYPGVTWLDRTGNYLTNTATVVERFTPIGNAHMQYEATISDPSVYSRPWKMSMVLYRHIEPNAELMEFNCVPFADMLLYGDLLDSRPTPQQ